MSASEQAAGLRCLSPAEYLAEELRAETKSEYVAGSVHAMAGATRAHNIIAVNALVLIGNHLRDKPCRPFGSDMRVRLPASVGEIYYSPDLSVTCDPSDTAELFLEKPVLVLEVLSPDTRRTDLREKRLAYFNLPSLHTYLILEQDCMSALMLRKIDNAWVELTFTDAEAELHLAPIDLRVRLGAFYDGITFP